MEQFTEEQFKELNDRFDKVDARLDFIIEILAE